MEEQPEDLRELKNRINVLRRQNEKKIVRSDFAQEYNLAVRMVIEFISPIILGLCIGYAIDVFFKITPICMIIFSIFGLMAGILNIYKVYIAIDKNNRK